MDNHHLRVLLIDDNRDDYMVTRNLLRKVRSSKFDLEWVSSYDDGIEAVERNQHDVVLLDDSLEQRSGLELLRQVVASGCQVPVIILTGAGDRETDLKAMEAGAADYLEKQHLDARLLERSIRYVVERKRVETALVAERNLLRALIDNIPDAVYAKDTESRFILCNKTHLRYLGLSSVDAVIGKTDFDLFPQDMAARFYADEQAVIQSGQPLINHEELTQDIANTTQFWAATTKAPLRDDTGKVLGIVGVSHDLTSRKGMEDALAAERSLLRTLIDTVPDAIFTKDKDSRFVLSNKSHLRLLGATTMDEVVGKTDFDLFPQEMAAKFYADERVVMQTDQPHTDHEERTIDLTTEKELWVATTKVPLHDEMGKVLGVVGITRDLTERKKAEDALRASEERYRTLVRNLPGVVVNMFDHDLRYTLSEGSMLDRHGYAPTMLEGKTIWEVLSPKRAAFYEPLYRAALAGQETVLEVENDGFIYRVLIAPVRNERGEIIAGLNVAEDITERKRAEAALRDSETRYRLVTRATNDAIWDWNLLTNQVEWSEALCSYFGYAAGDIVKDLTWWNEQIHPEDRARITSSSSAVIGAGGQYWTQEYRFRRADKTYALVIDRGYVIRDEAGKPLRMIGSMTDITERKQAEERLAAERNVLRTLIDALPDYIFVKDATGRFLVSNTAHALAVKVSNPDDLIGKTAADVFPPDMAAQFDADDQAIMQSGEPLLNLERQTIDAAGNPIWVATTKVPLRDEHGKVTGLVGISRDISERKEAEEVVRDSLVRYHLVARATNDVIWDWNLLSDTIEWNEAVETLFGYAQDQISQEVSWWINHIHPDDQERLGERFAALINGEQAVWTEEHRFLKADGTYADVIDRGVIATDQAGTPLRIIGSMIDITARKKAEEALQESEKRYRMTFEQAGVGVAYNDDTGRFLWVNQKYCDILGYTREELLERTWQELTHPDDREKDWIQAQQLLAGEISTYSLEKRYLHKNGSPVWVGMTTSLLRDSAGAIKHGIVVIEDISERKRAEAALRESEERFRILFEHSPDAIVLIDPYHPTIDWPIVECNEAACVMNGYSRAELIGQSIDVLNVKPAVAGERAEYFRRIRDEGILQLEDVHRHKDGSLIQIQIHSSLVNLNGRELVLGIDRDISERKQAEAALQESEERFRSTFEQVTVGMALVVEGGRWMRINRKLCEILGYSSDEMLERTWMEMTHPDDLNKDLEQTRRLEAGEIESYSMEKRFIRKDGSPVWTSLTTSLVLHPSGELNYGVSVIEDISVRKQMEATLATERNLLRTLIDNLPDYIYVKDTEGRFITTNEAGWRGFGVSSLDDLIGKTDFDFLPREIAEDHRVLEQQIIQSGKAILDTEEKTFEMASARYLWILTSKMPLRDSDGNIYGFVGISRDITERKQAEVALQESERRFRLLFQNSPDAIFLLDPFDPDNRLAIVDCNDMACTMHGYTREELIGQSLEMIQPNLPDPDQQAAFTSRLQQGSAMELEVDHRRKDGMIFPVHTRFTLVTIQGRELALGFDRDVTERKQAENALRESEARYRSLFEDSPISLWEQDFSQVVAAINELRQAGVNDLRTYLDAHPEQVQHLLKKIKVLDVNQTTLALYAAASKEQLVGYLEQRVLGNAIEPDKESLIAMAEGRTYFTEELVNYRLDGEPIHIVLQWQTAPGYEDSLAKVLLSIVDITERKQAEESLRESEEKFRQLAENVTQAFWLRDPANSKVIYASPAFEKVWGHPSAMLTELPDSFLEVVHPDDRERVWARYKFQLKGGFDDQFRIVHPDGAVRWVWARTYPVLNAAGDIYRVVGLAEDITLRKQAEAQEIELAAERTRIKVVERFIGDASHDLRTPLSIMQTSLYLLEKNTDPEKRKRHSDTLNEQISHITRVLEDFLNLGKLDQLSHADLNLEECDLSTLVHTIRTEQQPFIAHKRHQVQLHLAANLPPIMADKIELERALRHLIVNAINFTPDGGTISIETRQVKEYTVFEVRDNGIGISAEDLPFIFERFYRADKARDIATGGSGLGLTIARKIIEAHGGKIEVESITGEGSTFRVLL